MLLAIAVALGGAAGALDIVEATLKEAKADTGKEDG